MGSRSVTRVPIDPIPLDDNPGLVSLSEDADGTHAAAGVHAKVVG